MASAFSGYKTESKCVVTDYACLCANDIYIETYAMAVSLCDEDDTKVAWKGFNKSCTKAKTPLAESYKTYLSLGEEDHVDGDSITKKTVVTKPVKFNTTVWRNNYLSRQDKTHVLKSAENYVNILNAFWGLLHVLAFIRLVYLRIFSSKNGRPNALVTKLRKYLFLPATFGNKHVESVNLGKASLLTLGLRWQTVVIASFFILDIVFLFADVPYVKGPETVYYSSANELSRYIGDRASVLTIGLWPIAFVYGGRNNIIQFYTGWSFETFNVFHKAVSRILFMNACVHGGTYTYVYGHLGSFNGVGNWAYFKTKVYGDRDDMLGTVGIVIASAIILQSFYYFRHKWYEVFLALHIVLVVVFTAVIYHHVNPNGYAQYIYAAIAVWAFDRLVRIVRIISAGPFTKATLTAHGDATVIAAKPSHGWKAKPGQYAFLYVLRHNFWESHPFSIVENKDGNYIFVAKKHAGLTHKVHKSVSAKENSVDSVRVWIEGPYGNSFQIQKYETVLLIAGGIGITAIMSYALDLKRRNTQQHVILHWMVREQAALKWVKEQLDEISQDGVFEIHIYVTGENSRIIEEKNINDSNSEGIQSRSDSLTEKSNANIPIIFNQRPNLNSVVTETVRNASGSVALVSCGPADLADNCRKAAVENVDKGVGVVDYFEHAFSWA
ncbi:ferric reductase NAD binding domain-containing protein [Lipomyces japonicus]|uniref:ferric reductase NAD binding domain-containing protein n=1 Tax=Lipomyces japonicus TaxID=56871 RepID=UPI0034CD1CDB